MIDADGAGHYFTSLLKLKVRINYYNLPGILKSGFSMYTQYFHKYFQNEAHAFNHFTPCF